MAFPEIPGISEVDRYGRHTGLLMDYLNEIAKYTNWEYEYIPVDSDQLVDEFLEGRFDLMGGAYYSPEFEQFFAYPITAWATASRSCSAAAAITASKVTI